MKTVLSLEWERTKIEECVRVLDDIPVCREAEYAIRWIDDPMSPKSRVPVLQIGFPRFGVDGSDGHPAFGFRLTTSPSNTLLEGDKLRSHLRRCCEDFLRRNGVVWEPESETERLLVVTG